MSLTTKWERDAGGLPPVILLPAIQHTGSRFVRWDILKKYQHAQLHQGLVETGRTCYYAHLGSDRKPDKFVEYLENYPAIASLRHPRRVFKSWITRDQEIWRCIEEWEFLINKVNPFNPYYLPVDSDNRESYMETINTELNLRNDQNWRPRGNEKGTMYDRPEDIELPDEANDYIESIKWFIDQFWTESVTETTEVNRVLFKNVSSDRIEAYGTKWAPQGKDGDVQDVTDELLINKFRLYDRLEAIEFVDEPKVSDVEFETLKSQAISAGLKVDGRWKKERLIKEVQEYISNA